MEKQELLYLDEHAHLSVSELVALDEGRAEPALTRLQDRITRTAVARLDDSSGHLREILSSRRLGVEPSTLRASLRDATVDALRVAIREDAALAEHEDTLNEFHRLEEATERPSGPGPSPDVSVGDTLRLDEPIAFHPEFARDLAAAKLYRVSDAVGLPGNAARVLVERVGSLTELTGDRLEAMVADGSLSVAEARQAGAGAAMFNLLDDRPELVEAANARVGDIQDLAGLARDDWLRLIEDSGTTPPGGIDRREYAELLEHKVERLFPAETLHKRLRETDVPATAAENSELHALREQNPDVGIIGVQDFSALDTSSFSEAEVATLKAHFENTVRVAHRYAGMRLSSVLDDPGLSDADREREVGRRVDLANGFLADNPGVLAADLTQGSDDIAALSFGAAASDEDKAMLLANARVFQRALAVTDDINTADQLVTAGFHSALSLAVTRSELIVAKTGLQPEAVAAFKAKAERIASGVSAHVGSIIDIIKGGFVNFAVGNVSPKLGGWLKEIPGFDDFFGNQDYCDCKHCSSILSPAAYFVDLMTFVEDHITEPVFATKPTHPLTLQKRRPDLWKLEVTCHNTHTPIPYLVIVNEILENAIALATGFAGGLDDRVAVRASVYKDTLQNSVESFGLPFNLAFEQVKGYLGHYDQTLGDAAYAANAEGDTLARARLALPAKDFDLIVTPNTDLPFLIALFGIPFTLAGGAIQRFDAQSLLPPLGVSRSELADLIATRYVTADGAVSIRIKGSKRSAQSVQNDTEHIEGLTPAVLDRMHRFVRLWRATGWRIGELDLAMRHIHDAGMGADLDTAVIAAIAWTDEELDRRAVSLDDFLALWSGIPQQPLVSGGLATDPTMGVGATKPAPSNVALTVSLFDRLFNKSRFVDAAGPYPQPATSFLHAGLASVPPAAVDPNLHRLLAGLGVKEAELLDLVRGLARPLGIDLASANDADKQFALTIENLTLLYRHARLSRLLRVGPTELFALAALAPEIALAYVHDADDLAALFRLHTWWKASGWELGELIDIVLPGVPAIVTSPNPVTGTAGGEAVTSIASSAGTAQNAETVTFGANPDLAATITDWNSQAQHVVAYASDPFGVEDVGGQHLSLHPAAGTGAESQLEIVADSAAVFTPAPPTTARGATHPSPAAARAPRDAAVVAQELVAGVAESGAIVFADTAFAGIAPTAPSVTSLAPFAALAGGESVTYTPVRNGRSEPAETVTFAAATTIDAAVLDWNGQATATRAFRSDAGGVEDPNGQSLSLVLKGSTGSTARIVIDADSANLFAAAVPLSTTGAEITDTQSRAIVAANAALVEPADSESGYRVRAGVDPTTPLTVPAGVATSLAGAVEDVVLAHHSSAILGSLLPGTLGVAVDHLQALVQVLGVDLGDDVYFADLRGDTALPSATADLIRRLRRVAMVFGDPTVFTPERIRFIRDNSAIFGIADFDEITTESARRLAGLREIVVDRILDEDDPPELDAVLAAFDPVQRFANADQAELAELLRCGTALSQSLQGNTRLSAVAVDALQELIHASSFVQMLGVGGNVLTLALSSDYQELTSAGDAIQSAIRASFEDEDRWATAIEPIENALLSRRRDGLVSYLVNGGSRIFDEVDDLYHYFLLDVEVEGCMRTSRVAAAIDSVQLYVHRCARNLEGTLASDPNPIQVPPESVVDDEWAWRKNYRVWEANRKVFLYPENYIEPELRDDKTPLFIELEEDLLSREVTDEAIIEAYGKYLRGFDEVAHLTICGSYHEVDEDRQVDVLHLFGVTPDDPPVFYYRRVENVHFGVGDGAKATHWGNWEPLNIQVPVRKIAPVVHNSQLFVFWIRYVTKAQNSVKDGASKFTGYQHKAYVEFSRRKVDGRWTTPQKLRLDESPFVADSFPESYKDNGVVLDPIVPKDASKQEILWFEFTFYSNFEPLYDDVAHEIPKDDYTLEGFQWDQLYPASGEAMAIRGVNFQMWSPVDLYRFKIGEQYEHTGSASDEGVPWLNPGLFILIWILSGGNFDLTSLLPSELVWSRLISNGTRRELHSAPSVLPCFDTYTYATLLLDETRPALYTQKLAATDPTGSPGAWTGPQWDEVITDYLQDRFKVNRIGDAPSDVRLDVVNGSVGDVIIQTPRDAFYLQHGARADGMYHLRRLNTSVSENIADVLFNRGLEALLETSTQLGFVEAPSGLNLDPHKVFDDSKTGELDFDGPTGSYLREIFFNIPFLIADHLNSQGRFEEAQRWYHYIFDPTASETITNIPAGLSAEERQRRELDRNWRYREFRSLSLDTLRAQLTNDAAIEQYKRDPFNPHAIARLRVSAYQKSIVMKYIDNLLDWGDELFIRAFAELNPELLREATFMFISARELLGDRPAQLGDCGEGKVTPKTYPVIKKMLIDDSEFLMEIESIMSAGFRTFKPFFGTDLVAVDSRLASRTTRALYRGPNTSSVEAAATRAFDSAAAPAAAPGASRRELLTSTLTNAPDEVRNVVGRFTVADSTIIHRAPVTKHVTVPEIVTHGSFDDKIKWLPGWGVSLGRQISPVFCVPANDRIGEYWDRVEDRLYKIRHCQDIDGVFRLLPLFAPEIDPGLLVGGAAAGISLEDLLASASGALPPYRYRYLMERARSYAATVQGFGAELLSALEKRDAEELNKLRNIHQKNVLSLLTEVRKNEVKVAEDAIEVVARRQAAAQYRVEFYQELISTGLTGAELTQTGAQLTSMGVRATQTALAVAAGITYLLPQVGSPFSMKYGGQEVGNSLKNWSAAMGTIGQAADITAAIAGLAAGFERRAEGWEHQRKLAEHDVKVIEKDLAIANLRFAMANRALEMHEQAIAQHDEVMDFFANKFSNFGLYTYLSRTLQQLHRAAYEDALVMARLAEQAYRFERQGDTSTFVGGEWDASRSGLLAGERLVVALNNMDRRYVESSRRQAEINQSFSLSQIAPSALIDLKESAGCRFSIPEFYFDLYYPGQYRRQIRGVRLTVPCITGPYTNVSAKLTLERSFIRKEAVLGAASLQEVPVLGSASVATSTGQGDAGIFEFSFRDDRYLPFEGAGAVSEWLLELPAGFRPFDYHSINDIIVNISYVADEDAGLRQDVERGNAALEGALLNYLTDNTLTRVFSLRQEYSTAFNRLTSTAAGTAATFDIEDRHFPLFLQRRALQVASATMVIVPADRADVGSLQISINGTPATGFSAPTDPATLGDPFGGLPATAVDAAVAGGIKATHSLVVDDPGTLADPAGGAAFPPDSIQDILLIVEYGL